MHCVEAHVPNDAWESQQLLLIAPLFLLVNVLKTKPESQSVSHAIARLMYGLQPKHTRTPKKPKTAGNQDGHTAESERWKSDARHRARHLQQTVLPARLDLQNMGTEGHCKGYSLATHTVTA